MSFLPLRMNKNLVRITPLKADQKKDSHYRETVGKHRYDTAREVYCQVVMDKFDNRQYTWTGNGGDTTGHLCFKQSDLDGLSPPLVLRRGDLITGIRQWDGSWKTYDLEITQVTPKGHLPAPLLVFAYFNERHETRVSQ